MPNELLRGVMRTSMEQARAVKERYYEDDTNFPAALLMGWDTEELPVLIELDLLAPHPVDALILLGVAFTLEDRPPLLATRPTWAIAVVDSYITEDTAPTMQGELEKRFNAGDAAVRECLMGVGVRGRDVIIIDQEYKAMPDKIEWGAMDERESQSASGDIIRALRLILFPT